MGCEVVVVVVLELGVGGQGLWGIVYVFLVLH